MELMNFEWKDIDSKVPFFLKSFIKCSAMLFSTDKVIWSVYAQQVFLFGLAYPLV